MYKKKLGQHVNLVTRAITCVNTLKREFNAKNQSPTPRASDGQNN